MNHLSYAVKEAFNNLPYRDDQGESPYVASNGNGLVVAIQDGPIKDVGVNGIQVTELLELVKDIYVSMNRAYPCRENSITITKIEEAIHWQDARTKDRETRGVEGTNTD